MSDRTKSSKASKKSQPVVDLDATKNVTPTTEVVTTPVATPVVEVAQTGVEVAPVTEVKAKGKRSSKKDSTQSTTSETQVAGGETQPVKKSRPAKSKAEKAEKVVKPAKAAKTSKKQKTDTESQATEATQATQNGENAPEEDGKRYFRCVFKDSTSKIVKSGRYSGKKPQQAARKALRCIVKKNNVASGTAVLFVMRECTRNSKKKPYMYSGFCAKLDTPIEVPITKKDGTKSSIKYYHGQPKVTKASAEECTDLLNAVFHDDNVAQDQVVEEEVKVRVEKRSSRKAKATEPVQTTSTTPTTSTVTEPTEQKPRKKSKKETEVTASVVTPVTASVVTPVTASVTVTEVAEQKPAKKSKAKAESK